jgi:hypothetical protein
MLDGIKKTILWDYERGTWQYDLLCALIIATVFLVPGSFFGDRDRPMKNSRRYPQANAVSSAASNAASPPERLNAFLIVRADEIHEYLQLQGKTAMLESQPHEALKIFVREKLKREEALDRFDKSYNAQGQVDEYRIWFR